MCLCWLRLEATARIAGADALQAAGELAESRNGGWNNGSASGNAYSPDSIVR